MTIEFFTDDCEKTVPKDNRYPVKINEDSTITGVISAEYKYTPRVFKITGSNNDPVFMIITSSQKPGDTLVIINTTGASMTGMWLASTNHSYCRACGELKPNSRYETTWVNSGGNTYWTTPTYLSPYEYYVCTSPGTACDVEYVKPEGQFYTDKNNCEAACLPPPPTYYQCDLSVGVCSKTTEKTDFQDEAQCNADCSTTPPPVYFQCDSSLGTCDQTETKTEYTEKTACEQDCSKGKPSVYFQCDPSTGNCAETSTATEYTEEAACNKNCTPIPPKPSPTHAPEKKSLWWIGLLVVFLVIAVVLLIVFLRGRNRKPPSKTTKKVRRRL